MSLYWYTQFRTMSFLLNPTGFVDVFPFFHAEIDLYTHLISEQQCLLNTSFFFLFQSLCLGYIPSEIYKKIMVV